MCYVYIIHMYMFVYMCKGFHSPMPCCSVYFVLCDTYDIYIRGIIYVEYICICRCMWRMPSVFVSLQVIRVVNGMHMYCIYINFCVAYVYMWIYMNYYLHIMSKYRWKLKTCRGPSKWWTHGNTQQHTATHCQDIALLCVYGVASIRRLLKIIGLFCKRAL